MHFYVKFNTPDLCKYKIDFNISEQYFNLKIKNIQQITNNVNDIYDGSYEAVPSVKKQILETKNKIMTNNLTIREIPYFKTDNTFGGSTVYIGEEV